MMKVVAFAGSARKTSCNAGLLRYVKESIQNNDDLKESMEIVILDDVGSWPMFNQDLVQEKEVPKMVLDGIATVAEAHAVIVVTPEYNYSMSPVTTNTVAWLSKDEISPGIAAPLRGKPLGLLSAGGGIGGLRAQYAARTSFPVFLDMPVMAQPEVGVRIFTDPLAFDLTTGTLTSENEMKKIDAWVKAFHEFVAKFALYQMLEVSNN